jgi:SAM-dependent methyltransferase
MLARATTAATPRGSADGCAASAYALKSPGYFAGARRDLVLALPENDRAAVLEVGCGTGVTGALALGSGRAGRWVGIELFPAAAAEAQRVLSEVIVGDVERLDLPWPEASFDALVLSEVLEHLIEPWSALERLAPLVRPGGLVLASSPNVAHWRVVTSLLRGRFDLTDQGVFDRTHMRWFTPASFRTLFERAGFAVDAIAPVTPFAARTRLLSRLGRGRLDHLFMVQIALRGHRR